MTKNNNIEVINRDTKPGDIHSAVFDFDGTLSLIRKGWQDIMTPYFTQVLMETPDHASYEEENKCARDFIDFLTGKQTIYQCIKLNDEVVKRGGQERAPLEYKDEYNKRLLKKIEYRRRGLADGSIKPEEYLVPGSVGIIEALLEEGVDIYIASGTDEAYVKEEVALLKLDGYFKKQVYGAREDYKLFSKAMVINRIIKENDLHSSSLVGFGDGYVEIENIKEVDGIAIGVATDEENLAGVDPWKRQRLIKAGADIIIQDFTAIEELRTYLFGK